MIWKHEGGHPKDDFPWEISGRMKAVRKFRKKGGPAISNRSRTRVGEVFASAEAVDEWKAEKRALERDIAMKQERLARVNMRLQAAGHLIGEASPSE